MKFYTGHAGESVSEVEDGEPEEGSDKQQSDEYPPADELITDQSHSTNHMVREEQGGAFPTLSVQSLKEDIEKGKAVKHQNG